ncbi:hypothetical protein [Mariniphaga sediminis]|uniref:hypothetical protein n=1 Tax=Mariniphaga sediminis TaxID=1628158 RepID=UPI0035633D44
MFSLIYYICDVKLFRNISVYILTVAFLLSASGILVFHSHCFCTGGEQISVYVSPETCEETIHIHHKHEGGEEEPVSEDDCHECTPHTDECGCNILNVKFVKLEDQVIHKKVRVEKIQPVQLKILEIASILLGFPDKVPEVELIYTDPPKRVHTSLNFLISIQQLKIPCLA